MTRSIRPCGNGSRQATVRSLNVALAVTVLLTALWAGPAAVAATSGSAHRASIPLTAGPGAGPFRSSVKYYIVPPAPNGQKVFHFEIAAKILGNGDSYKEIFSLKKGRLQPDGGRLESPSAVDPGWMMILPADAHGLGVYSGPLPASSASGQQNTGGVWKSWISRALAGCLVLLGMILVAFAARALLMRGRQRGRHRYGDEWSHAAAHAGRGVSRGGRRGAHAGIAWPDDPDDRETAPPVRPPRTASTAGMAVTSPAPAPSPEADHRLQTSGTAAPRQEPCALPQATAVTTGPSLTTGPPREPENRGSAPSLLAAAVPATTRDPGATVGDGTDGSPFSPAALRLLGVRARSARKAATDAGVLRHEVVLGDYRVQAVLAEAPASSREGRSPEAKTWVASTPYLVWTPLPRDVPGGGLAFACVGAGEEGCLFIDLAAAPGAVALGGEHEAVARLAESIVHQLSSGPAADRIRLVVVGDAVPGPHLPGREWVASIGDLGRRGQPSRTEQAELVFCRLNSNEDVFPLARYVDSAPYRVVPLVLADLPGAPWSFTAYPSRRPSGVLQPVVP